MVVTLSSEDLFGGLAESQHEPSLMNEVLDKIL